MVFEAQSSLPYKIFDRFTPELLSLMGLLNFCEILSLLVVNDQKPEAIQALRTRRNLPKQLREFQSLF